MYTQKRDFPVHRAKFQNKRSPSYKHHSQFSHRISQEVIFEEEEDCINLQNPKEANSGEKATVSSSTLVPESARNTSSSSNPSNPIQTNGKRVKDLINVWDNKGQGSGEIDQVDDSSGDNRKTHTRPRVPPRKIPTKNIPLMNKDKPDDTRLKLLGLEKSAQITSAENKSVAIVQQQPHSHSMVLFSSNQRGGGDGKDYDLISSIEDDNHCDTKIFKTVSLSDKHKIEDEDKVARRKNSYVEEDEESGCCLSSCFSCLGQCCIGIMEAI